MKRAGRTLPAKRITTLAVAVMMSWGCRRAAPDSTPEGAVRQWIETMETATMDPRVMKDAYRLLGPRSRDGLVERAERTSRSQGRRWEAYEMLAEGRFGLTFRPKSMTSRIDGESAVVDVRGEEPSEVAHVRCTREGAAWRVELELPSLAAAPQRPDGGT